MKWEYGLEESFDVSTSGDGLFICNEGNFQYGNASLSYYTPSTREVQNEVFYRANGMKLGDVAQSMTIHNGIGWIVVNNSHVVFAIDINTFKEVGRITGLTSPRYMHFISEEKAYITQIWDNRIFVVNPRRYEITGYIEVPYMTMEHGSTEQMAAAGDYLYVCCWAASNRILKIDTTTDSIVGELEVGMQPSSLAIDCYGKLWVVTEGENNRGGEAPTLYRIDTEMFYVEESFTMNHGTDASEIAMNGMRDTIYWINEDVWAMDVLAEKLPEEPFLDSRGTMYYGLTVSPKSGDVYIADAIDFSQQGKVYRYSPEAELVDEFYVGLIPGAFCWR